MDTQAIEKHYRENRQKLVKRMTFRCGTPQDAEDIVQEAYYRVLKYNRSFAGDGFDKWFTTIINNCLRDQKNIEKGHSADEFDEELADGISCSHYNDQVMKEVFELIATKSVMQQEILTLAFEQDYTPIDISRITDYTYSNCHQVIRRFRQELRELYSE